jgi:multidrug efflux pump subunit AcrA (membrane-fusion protein)
MNSRAPILRRALPLLVVSVPLALVALGPQRNAPARAQDKGKEKEARPVAESVRVLPRQILLTEKQERALDVKTVVAARKLGDHPLVTGGKVSLDIERTARVRPLVNSTIYEVKKHAGDEVQKGDDLLVVESTDLGDAKNNYLTALANLEVAAEAYRREAILRATHATTDVDYHNARGGFRTAVVAAESCREKCLLLGVRSRELDELESELPLVAPASDPSGLGAGDEPVTIKPPSDKEREEDARRALREIAQRREHRTPTDEDTRRRARYTIRAPIDGLVIAKDAARGEFVDPSQIILTVSDVSRLWINLDVYQIDIAKVRVGAKVDVFTPTYPDTAFVGSVTFISESVDDTTHTLKARVVVDNRDRLLKSGMAAKTVIHCVDEKPEIELSPEAVVRDGGETFVIVKRAPGRYERRKVSLGLEAEDAVHVTSGLAEGEEVALEGNLFIHTSIPLGD